MKQVNSLVCVGLDSDFSKLPTRFTQEKYPQFAFNQWIIEQTHEFVCAYKPNMAFYEARGDQGIAELKMTLDYLHKHHPDIFTICDAKRADIGSTNLGYVEAIFDWLGFDSITVHPYLGKEAVEPFLARKDKVVIVLCRTSNPGSPEFQDLKVGKKMIWEVVAEHVSKDWNKNGNCMLVVGATYPKELAKVRSIVGEMTILVPGIGAQGGDVKQTVQAGRNSKGQGMIINSARSIIFDKNPGHAAGKLRVEINKFI